MREVISGKGSRFLLCRLAQSDSRYRKYPPQPVNQCDGHVARGQFTLTILPDRFSICRLESGATLPHWANGDFVSITRTDEELSIVCPQAMVPDGVTSESGWHCLRVKGTLDFSMVGVISALTKPLAESGISVFVLSTYLTDYLLVKEQDLEGATRALEIAGHRIENETASGPR